MSDNVRPLVCLSVGRSVCRFETSFLSVILSVGWFEMSFNNKVGLQLDLIFQMNELGIRKSWLNKKCCSKMLVKYLFGSTNFY